MKEEAKMVYLLECLQKTPPPVSVASQAGPGHPRGGKRAVGAAHGRRSGTPGQRQRP